MEDAEDQGVGEDEEEGEDVDEVNEGGGDGLNGNCDRFEVDDDCKP